LEFEEDVPLKTSTASTTHSNGTAATCDVEPPGMGITAPSVCTHSLMVMPCARYSTTAGELMEKV
jgi:hypothetical protein